jgi:outer membrane protein
LRKPFITFPALALGSAMLLHGQGSAPAPATTKVGIIHIQNAILGTKDGQKAANELQSRFMPKKQDLDKKQQSIAQLQDQLRKGSNTMSEDAKQKLMRDIDQNTKSLNRETEDAQAELDQEQGKIMQDLGQRIMAVIDKYAKDNGYTLILDVSSQQTPVLYAANGIDITNDIVGMYDKNAPPAAPTSAAPRSVTPGGTSPGAVPPATRPATPGIAPPPRPVTPPAQKKQ